MRVVNKMADIGRMDKRVTFYSQQSVTNPTTHTTKKVYTEYKTVWASIECKSSNRTSGHEYMDAGARKNKLVWDVYTRYQGCLNNCDMQIHYGNRVFDITAVCPADNGRMIHFICEEVIQ